MSCVIMFGAPGTGSPKLLAWADGLAREFRDRGHARSVGATLVAPTAAWWEIVPLPAHTPPKPDSPTR